MSTLKERFYEVMDSLGLTDYRVYTDVDGITQNMMVKLRKGETSEVSTKILYPFLNTYTNVNANYIFTGRGNMFFDKSDNYSDTILARKSTPSMPDIEDFKKYVSEAIKSSELLEVKSENVALKNRIVDLEKRLAAYISDAAINAVKEKKGA